MTLYPWGRVFLWGQLLTLYHFRSRSWKLLPWIWSIGWGRRLKMGKISKTNHKNGRTSSCKFVHSSATFCHYGENSHILFNFFPWRDSSVTCFFVLSQITRASIEIWLSLYLFKKVKNSNKENETFCAVISSEDHLSCISWCQQSPAKPRTLQKFICKIASKSRMRTSNYTQQGEFQLLT